MSSTNTTPNKFFTPTQYPVLPRRATITPSQRPSTSGGEGIEPKSDFLRDALREKKGLPPRSQSTTPRKKMLSRPPRPLEMHDDMFLPSSDDEAKFGPRRSSARSQRTRRASDANVVKSSPSTQVRNLGLREAEGHMDKLLKENWDLKHRITLHDTAYSKLRAELDEALEELAHFSLLRDRNKDLEDAIEIISRHAAEKEEENKAMKITNAELTVLNDDLMRELEVKDNGIQQRQVAIEEAAGIIQKLEDANEKLKKQSENSPRPDSDYFSGESESTPSMKASMRPTTAGTCGTECTTAPDSDYFSADSPCLTPTTPRKMALVQQKEKALQIERAKAMGAAFNREIGLRGQASKDSLLSTFLETPVPEASKANKGLRRRAQIQASPPRRGSIREELLRAGTPEWSDARRLKDIYEDGSLHKRLGSVGAMPHRGYTPSVTVASTVASRAASSEDVFSLAGGQRSVSTLASLATSVSGPASMKPGLDKPLPSQPQKVTANPTPVNYSAWPRQLPEWPPSAGLRNRDILFHGQGMEEMFPDSPPRPSSSREMQSFSNVHLLRSSAKEGHSRSSSAAPAANAIAPPPPPSGAPPSLPSRTRSLHKFSASLSMPRRPAFLDRSRTMPSAS